MSNRERWTVYPLLFLTLGIALKDKITKRTDTDTVICKSLYVTDRQLVPQVIVKSTPAGGIVHTQGRQTNVLLGHTDNLSGLLITNAKGDLVARFAIPSAGLGQPSDETPPPQQEPEPAVDAEK
jgi:hypothetical protein